jgi:hypothetical protein
MAQYSHKSRYLKEALSLNYSDRQGVISRIDQHWDT